MSRNTSKKLRGNRIDNNNPIVAKPQAHATLLGSRNDLNIQELQKFADSLKRIFPDTVGRTDVLNLSDTYHPKKKYFVMSIYDVKNQLIGQGSFEYISHAVLYLKGLVDGLKIGNKALGELNEFEYTAEPKTVTTTIPNPVDVANKHDSSGMTTKTSEMVNNNMPIVKPSKAEPKVESEKPKKKRKKNYKIVNPVEKSNVNFQSFPLFTM